VDWKDTQFPLLAPGIKSRTPKDAAVQIMSFYRLESEKSSTD
jgi:hypothetical protein